MINKRSSVLMMMAAAIVLLAQCSPKAGRKVASNKADAAPVTSAEKIADIKKHYSEDQMAEGKTIFNTSCARCHKLKMPETRTVAQWEQILPPMSRKAALNEQQAALVRAYVLPLAKME